MGVLVPTDARPQLRRRRHVVARATVLGVLAAVSLIGPGVTGAATTPADAVGAAHPGLPTAAPATSASTSATAQARLRALADTIQAAPADRQAGRYTYHHLRRWILDTTGTPAPLPNSAAMVALDHHRWVAEDGSGVEIAVEIGPDYQLTAAHPDHRSTDAEFAGHLPVRAVHPAGHMGSPIAGPLATDPAGLARQLEFDLMPDGPADTLTAVDMLYSTHHPTRPVRAAVLRVLAGVPGLAYHPVAGDRLGRRGIAISLDRRNVRYSLIIDPSTGDLLAAEQRLTGPHDFLPVPAGHVVYYTLLLDHGQRPASDQTAPDLATRIDRHVPRSARRVHSG